MSWTKRVKHPKNLLNVGDDIECQVLEVDSKAKRISLSIKELEPDPWTLFVNEFNPGDKIGGKVRSITDYGIFIGIRDGVDGMVHKSDLSWTLRVANPADLFQKNDDVEAVILSINHDEKKVSLGIKQLFDDPWSRIPNDYPPGQAGGWQGDQHLRGRRLRGARARDRRLHPDPRVHQGDRGRHEEDQARRRRAGRGRVSRRGRPPHRRDLQARR
jgi:predicted RNA-binding protein with RPS1 domain